jgi:hypothetical protein
MANVQDLWCGFTPIDAVAALAGVSVPWWVAGGWAIELFVPPYHRDPADLDVGCFRRDFATLRSEMAEWEMYAAEDGALSLLDDASATGHGFASVWSKPKNSECWAIQIMIEDAQGKDWRFRRADRIRRSVNAITWKRPDGPLVLEPEIQLLYKAKNVRGKDQADFDAALPLLSPERREWLDQGLASVHPNHRWRSQLRSEAT